MAKRRGQGEGSIYQMKDGRWRAAVSLGWKNNTTEGNVVWKRKVLTARTRSDVQEQLTKILRDQDLGLPICSQKQSTAQFLKGWLESVEIKTRPKTYTFYEYIVRIHLVPGLGKVQVSKLTPQNIQQFINEKADSNLASRTVRHIHRTLCTALETAVRFGDLPRNVASLASPPRATKPKVSFMTVEQAKRFLAAAQGDRLYPLYAVVLSLGLRLGEALGLSWDDLNLEAGKLSVEQSLQKVKGEWKLVAPKSENSRRTVRLPAIAAVALLEHRRKQLDEQLAKGWKVDGWNLVFRTLVGTPMDQTKVLRQFQKLLKFAGLPKMRIHDLRHSAASILIAQGVGGKEIAYLLGHASEYFTLQVYGHLMEESKQAVANKMDDALNPVATNFATKAENSNSKDRPN